MVGTKEQKIGFFGEKSVFGWHGNDFDKKKSVKNPIFPEILSKLYLGHSRERN